MTEGQPEAEQNSFLELFASGAVAATIAEATTLPLDTAKVRLQLQSFGFTKGEATKVPTYRGTPLHVLATIIRNEGITGPFKGLVPGIHRQVIFTGIRLGLYDEVKQLFAQTHRGEDEPLLAKVAAALCVSAAGITLANPSDVVKVRFQSQTWNTRRQLGYTSTAAAYRRITADEGVVGGLYRVPNRHSDPVQKDIMLTNGFTANLVRNSVISATEIVTYDVTKQALLHRAGMEEGLTTHFAAAMTAGFAATCVGSPADVVGTRIMTDRSATQKGLVQYVVHMVRDEGVRSLYKGFVPNFARIGSFNVMLWLSYEKLKTVL